MKNLYLVVGESGSGKDTIVDALCAKMNVRKIVSHTTRARRSPDENTHVFVSEDDFMKLMPDMIATTHFDGSWYGTTAEIANASDFYIIDPVGVQTLNRDRICRNIVCLYITVSPELRKERMIGRGQTEAEAQNRIDHDAEAFCGFDGWDYIVNNDESFDTTLRELENIIAIEEAAQ